MGDPEGDGDAPGLPHLVALHPQSQPFGDPLCLYPGDPGQQQQELLATAAAQGGIGAQVLLHQGRQGDDDGVPDVVAEVVIDGLEVIDIEGDDRQWQGLRLIVVQHLLHRPPVEEARHGVGVTVVVQLVDLGVEQP
ncbi:hypothetical protein D3C84_985860 [compost metagenome]